MAQVTMWIKLDLQNAIFSSSKQQLPINPEGATVSFVLEASICPSHLLGLCIVHNDLQCIVISFEDFSALIGDISGKEMSSCDQSGHKASQK